MPSLFDALKLGDLWLPNRILMAPLTRRRAGDLRTGNHLMAEYYAQRASAGLIVSEATCISPMGVGHERTPGIWSKPQIEGWKIVTDAVHAKGGRIFLQLWHVGRLSHPVFLDGQSPVAPSEIAVAGHLNLLEPRRAYVVPRSLDVEEIPAVIEEFRLAAQNAMQAGFDGVELHGANGYLLEQFLSDDSNRRCDEYGGSISNRARFVLEAVDAVTSVWGPDRVGIHLSPSDPAKATHHSEPQLTYAHLGRELSRRRLAFIFVREPIGPQAVGPVLRKAFDGVYIANQALTQAAAESLLAEGAADAAAFGGLFISNPDLPMRFAMGAAVAAPDPQSFYTPGPEGYTSYPCVE